MKTNAMPVVTIHNIEAEGSCQEHTRNVDAPDYPMELAETLTKAIGELHGAQQKRACYSMRQQPPLKGLIVLPNRVLRMYQETSIVTDNVGQHQADGSKEQIFCAGPRTALERYQHRGHGKAPATIDSCRPAASIMTASLTAKTLLPSSLSSHISVSQGGSMASELWIAAIIAQFVRGACWRRYEVEVIVDAGD
jgi:hypothetical protein